jgi:hypothetical protein
LTLERALGRYRAVYGFSTSTPIKIFSFLFTWLIGQRFTDTLCGTKVLYRSDYLRLKNAPVISATSIRSEIDLIFGASRLSFNRHGLLLLRMV